jgi:uncharacterized protein YkwD
VKTKWAVALTLVALIAIMGAALPAAASASTSLKPYEKKIVKLVNKERAKHHLKALRVNVKLVKAARSHSKDMATRDYFDHNTLGAETWSQRIVRFGYTQSGCRLWKAGEDIYRGSGLFSDPHVVVLGAGSLAKGWMTSAPHRKVILTKTFRDVGIGAVKSDSGQWYFTLDLGRRIKE